MQQNTYSLDGIEWSGWPLEDAVSGSARRRYAGFVYVLQFSDGWTKVGSSASVRRRMRDHVKDAMFRSATVERIFISKPHDAWRDNEKILIEHCNRLATGIRGREYFQGVAFDKAVRALNGMPQTLRTLEELAQREEAADRRFASFSEAMRRVGQMGRKGEDTFDLAALLALSREIGRAEAEQAHAERENADAQRKIDVYKMWFDPKNSIDLDTFAASVGIESGARLAEHFGALGIFDRSIHPITGAPRDLPEFKWLHCFKIFISRIPTGGFVDVAWILPEGQLEIVEELRNNGLIDV